MKLRLARLAEGFLIFWFSAVLTPAPASPAPARAAATQPAAGRQADETVQLKRLVSVLQDTQKRAELVSELQAMISAEQQAAGKRASTAKSGPDVLDLLLDRVARLNTRVDEFNAALAGLPALSSRALDYMHNPEQRRRWLEAAGKIVFIFILALALQAVASGLVRRARTRLPDGADDSAMMRIVAGAYRMILGMMPLAVFAGVAYGSLSVAKPGQESRVLALALFSAYLLERLVSMIAGVLLLSRRGLKPILAVSEETAGYGYVWIQRFAVVITYGYFFSDAFVRAGGPESVHFFLVSAIGLLLAGMMCVLILQCREPVRDWIRGSKTVEQASKAGVLSFLADAWPMAAIVYVIAVYGIWLMDIQGGFRLLLRATVLTVIIAVLARLVAGAVDDLINRGFRIRPELRERYPGLEVRVNRYLPIIARIANGAVYVIAAALILDAWGLSVTGWLASGPARTIFVRTGRIVIIVVGSLLAWETLSLLIQRFLQHRDQQSGAVVEASARMKTLLPLFQNVLRVTISVIAVLMILPELGVNIGPLLAGAGVAGIAVGFGAQNLVKDVITGTFILLEDAVVVGDVADVGGHVGVVERLTIRTIRLRDLEGIVHIVPFGQVTGIRNFTKDYSYALLEVGVAYREDVDEVIEILKEVAEELRKDEKFGPLIAEPLEVLGLDSFGESSVNIRARFKTLPIQQWTVKREFNRRIKRAFDERNIEIPFPHQTIYFGVDKDGNAPPVHIDSGDKPADNGD